MTTTSLAPSRFQVFGRDQEGIETAAVYLRRLRFDDNDDEEEIAHRRFIEPLIEALRAQEDEPATFFDWGVNSANTHATAVASAGLFQDWVTRHQEARQDISLWASRLAAALALNIAKPSAHEVLKPVAALQSGQQTSGISLILRTQALRDKFAALDKFEYEDTYFDSFGALVVEHYRRNDRLTIVMEHDRITVMTMVKSRANTRIFHVNYAEDNDAVNYAKARLAK
jgi:hypothetical protein